MFRVAVDISDAGVRRMAFAVLARIGDLTPQMVRLGQFMRREAGDRLKNRMSENSHGKLRGSLAYHAGRTFVFVGSNLKYAAVQQLGGVIRPVTARMLAIPLLPHIRKQGVWPRDWDEHFPTPLFLWPPRSERAGTKVFLARRKSKRDKTIELVYRLVAKATVRGRPYILFDRAARLFLRDQLARVIARFRR